MFRNVTLYAMAALAVAAVATTTPASANIFDSIGKAAKGAVHTVEKGAKSAGHFVEKVSKPVGKTVSTVYGTAGYVADRVPVLNSVAPLAKDVAKAAKSKTGRIGATIGLAAGVATGGLSYAAAGAAQGALTGHYGNKVYKFGKHILHR
jgi:hypothetical protein